MTGHYKHGGGHHHFKGAEQWAKHFDSKERDAWQKPDAVIAAMALTPAMRVADIGAGTGYFAVRIARAVPRGEVLAVDIEPDMIRYLGERAKKEGLKTLQPVLAGADDPKIQGKVQRVVIVNTAHHIADRAAYFGKVKAALDQGGQIHIVEFKMGDIPVGPPEAMRICANKLDGELRGSGLARVRLDVQTLPHQYIAVYEAAP